MIQIASANLLVIDSQGRRQSFDPEQLRQDLRGAFRAFGVTEDWLAEHIALTVEERVRAGNDEHQTPLATAEVDQLICSVLSAAGYNDVAAEYSRMRHIDPLQRFRDKMLPWSPERLSTLLRRSFPLDDAQLQAISSPCADILRQLAFSLVSDTFLCELAIHVIHRGPGQPRDAAGQANSPAERPAAALAGNPDAWLPRVDAPTRAYLGTRALRPLPLSSVFPRARVAIALATACRQDDAAWLSELTVMSALAPLSKAALDLLGVMRQDLVAQWPHFASAPSHVIFPGFQPFLDSAFSSCKRRERLLLAQELQDLLHSSLVKKAPYPLILSFR